MMMRERGDRSTFGLPPQAEPSTELPPTLPWDRPIAELAAFHLEAHCRCGRTSMLPLRLLAGEQGWKQTLRELVPRLRCGASGCRARPSIVRLIKDAGNDRRSGRARWYQLVPAGDEELFPH